VRLAVNAALLGLLIGAGGLAAPPVAEAAERLAVGGMATVAGTGESGLRVRSGPGTQRQVVIILAEGRTVPILDGPVTAGGVIWYKVQTRGPAGWVMARYLTPAKAEAVVAARSGAASARSTPAPTPAPTRAPAASGAPAVTVPAPGAGPRSFVARITAYATGDPGVGTRTATGTTVRWGVVAVDPAVIPLGSQLEIEGVGGRFVAEDVGGGVRGAHVDVFVPEGGDRSLFKTPYRKVTVVREGNGR
jgi:3D (Asp-Asp-Asp) domain-containing protein